MNTDDCVDWIMGAFIVVFLGTLALGVLVTFVIAMIVAIRGMF